MGARAIAMPCNTAHHWESEMMEGSGIPFISIVDATLSALGRMPTKPRSVGLIATAATLHSGFYQRRLKADGIACILPSETAMAELVLPGIALVKRNRIAEATPLFVTTIGDMIEAGATVVILACTEVDIALAHADLGSGEKYIDTNRALAQACIDWELDQRRPIP